MLRLMHHGVHVWKRVCRWWTRNKPVVGTVGTPCVDLFWDEAAAQVVMAQQFRSTTHVRGKGYWQEITCIPMDELEARGRDVIVGALLAYRHANPTKPPDSPPELSPETNRGLNLMRALMIWRDPREEVRIVILHRDGAGGHLGGKAPDVSLSTSCTRVAFAQAVRSAFEAATDSVYKRIMDMSRHSKPERASDAPRVRRLVEEWDSLGFYQLVSPTQAGTIKEYTLECGESLLAETNRVFDVDSEDLCECGILILLREIKPFLEAVGAPVTSFAERVRRGGSYSVVINGTAFEINSATEGYSSDWRRSAMRSYAVVNGLLKAASVEERIYHGDDYERIMFLTDPMLTVLREFGLPKDTAGLTGTLTAKPVSG